MRSLCLAWLLFLALGCGDDDGGGGGGEPDAPVDPADAAALPDSPPAPDAPPSADSGPTADARPYPDGGVVKCGSKALYEDCGDGSECASCLCWNNGTRSFCNQACTGPSDCPDPSPGCDTIFDVCLSPP